MNTYTCKNCNANCLKTIVCPEFVAMRLCRTCYNKLLARPYGQKEPTESGVCRNCGLKTELFAVKYGNGLCMICFHNETFVCVCEEDVLKEDGHIIGQRPMCTECAIETAQHLTELVKTLHPLS